ncbi:MULTISPECIES: elongation factor Tu [unclassified Microbacterium]|uniref:elongation factor Tu n=1 Tax=unclassified Microbacterium TaxID=2609290 RepID=UPI0012FC81E0|nr:elongation factor Tu [Microbacterium sp. MAH-37]MVQ41850.1 elongation factor Tu [Microbacterium sp. MAH-37]
MGLFRRAERVSQPNPAATGPFRFEIDDVFVITFRGPVFTGRVASGSIAQGSAVVLEREQGSLSGVVKEINVRRRKRDSTTAGDEAGLMIDGIGVDDLPLRPTGDGHVIDSAALRGAVITAA